MRDDAHRAPGSRIWALPGSFLALGYLVWAVVVYLAVPWLGVFAPGLAIAPYVLWLGLAIDAISESGQGGWGRSVGRAAVALVLVYALVGYPLLDADGRLFGSAGLTLVVHGCVAVCLLGAWHRIARVQSDSAAQGARVAVYVATWLAVFFPPTAFAFVHPRIAAAQRMAP